MKIQIIAHEYPLIDGGEANTCMNSERQYASNGHIVDMVRAWFDASKDMKQLRIVVQMAM